MATLWESSSTVPYLAEGSFRQGNWIGRSTGQPDRGVAVGLTEEIEVAIGLLLAGVAEDLIAWRSSSSDRSLDSHRGAMSFRIATRQLLDRTQAAADNHQDIVLIVHHATGAMTAHIHVHHARVVVYFFAQGAPRIGKLVWLKL